MPVLLADNWATPDSVSELNSLHEDLAYELNIFFMFVCHEHHNILTTGVLFVFFVYLYVFFLFCSQMLLPILMLTLAKEMVQLFWMMWSVLGMKAGLLTVNILPIMTAPTLKMLELVAKLNVSV